MARRRPRGFPGLLIGFAIAALVYFVVEADLLLTRPGVSVEGLRVRGPSVGQKPDADARRQTPTDVKGSVWTTCRRRWAFEVRWLGDGRDRYQLSHPQPPSIRR